MKTERIMPLIQINRIVDLECAGLHCILLHADITQRLFHND